MTVYVLILLLTWADGGHVKMRIGPFASEPECQQARTKLLPSTVPADFGASTSSLTCEPAAG